MLLGRYKNHAQLVVNNNDPNKDQENKKEERAFHVQWFGFHLRASGWRSLVALGCWPEPNHPPSHCLEKSRENSQKLWSLRPVMSPARNPEPPVHPPLLIQKLWVYHRSLGGADAGTNFMMLT